MGWFSQLRELQQQVARFSEQMQRTAHIVSLLHQDFIERKNAARVADAKALAEDRKRRGVAVFNVNGENCEVAVDADNCATTRNVILHAIHLDAQFPDERPKRWQLYDNKATALLDLDAVVSPGDGPFIAVQSGGGAYAA